MGTYDKRAALFHRIKDSFDDPDYCDVAVVDKDGGTTHCVSWVLCTGSDVFDKMLRSEMLEGASKTIHITDVDSVVLKSMLEFMHTAVYDITHENLIPLIFLGDKYNIQELVQCCEDFRKDELVVDAETCCSLLMEALQYKVDSIVGACVEYMVWNMDEVCFNNDLGCLSRDAILLLKTRAKKVLVASKSENGSKCMWLVVGIAKWVEASSEVRFKHLKTLLEDLDFDCLDVHELARVCSFGCVQNCTDLWGKIVGRIGKVGQVPEPKTVDRGITYSTPRKRETLEIRSPSWYSIRTQAAKSTYFPDDGICLEGHVLLEKGDKLEILVGKGCKSNNGGSNGGGACVVLNRQRKKTFLFVCGGGSSRTFHINKSTYRLMPGEVPDTFCDADAWDGGCDSEWYVCSKVRDFEKSYGSLASPTVLVKRDVQYAHPKASGSS